MQTEQAVYTLRQGSSRLLVSMPHVGTYLPGWLTPRLTPAALRVADTDWHLPLLYDFLDELDATVLIATHSRYVLDLNRAKDGSSLYPGLNTTGICPVDSFDEQPLYLDGQQPDAAEIQQRIADYWEPYHQVLAAELSRLKSRHGSARLLEAHSIDSRVPRFFQGELPNFNIGSNDGQACALELAQQMQLLTLDSPYSSVVDGRFKGGYITRHYGQPASGVQALQLEIAFRTYLDERAAAQFIDSLAMPVRPLLRNMVELLRDWEA